MDRSSGAPTGPRPGSIPEHTEPIRVKVRELPLLFAPIDPSLLHEKDLEPEAERFIISWAKELRASRSPLALEIIAEQSSGLDVAVDAVVHGVHTHFLRRSQERGRELRELLRRGRTSLAIGLVFLAGTTFLAGFLSRLISSPTASEIVRQGLTVGGWVAMWRPLEIFLYAWWPVESDRRLMKKLSAMPVFVTHGGHGKK